MTLKFHNTIFFLNVFIEALPVYFQYVNERAARVKKAPITLRQRLHRPYCVLKRRENVMKCRKKKNCFQVCFTFLLRHCQVITNTSQLNFVSRLIKYTQHTLRFYQILCKTFRVTRLACAFTTFSLHGVYAIVVV